MYRFGVVSFAVLVSLALGVGCAPIPALRVSFHEARAEEGWPAWTGSQWRVMSTLATDAPVGALTGQVVVHTDPSRSGS